MHAPYKQIRGLKLGNDNVLCLEALGNILHKDHYYHSYMYTYTPVLFLDG